MSRFRKKLTLTIMIIVILIGCMSIAYAALTQNLTISGTGTVNASNWDIRLKNSTNYFNRKTGTATFTTPVVNGTTIANYTVTFEKPGDSVTLYFDVENKGDLLGEISSIVSKTPQCTSATGNTSDANLICNNLNIAFSYANDDQITSGDTLNLDSYTCLNNSEYSQDEETTLKLTITLNQSMTSVPSSKVTISNLKHDIIYTQTENECESNICFRGNTLVSTKEGFKKIKDIKEGDYVYSINLETNQKELKKVIKTFKRQTRTTQLIETNNEKMETTSAHEYYVIDKGWINAKKLTIKDKLYNMNEKMIQVKSNNKKIYKESVTVYNFTVEDNHNYFITKNEILVHNELGTGCTEEQ